MLAWSSMYAGDSTASTYILRLDRSRTWSSRMKIKLSRWSRWSKRKFTHRPACKKLVLRRMVEVAPRYRSLELHEDTNIADKVYAAWWMGKGQVTTVIHLAGARKSRSSFQKVTKSFFHTSVKLQKAVSLMSNKRQWARRMRQYQLAL